MKRRPKKSPKPSVRRRARANPKPRAWSAKGPSRAYECKSPLVGRTVRLGRSEAVVESCATPSRRRPNQGQFRVRSKATGKSRAVPRRRVSAALYRAKHPRKMPAGLLKFWSKTREGGSARPSMAEAYGPRESLGVGAFEEARALPYGPRESLGTGAFEEGRRSARSAPPQESIQQAVHRVVMQFAAIGGWRIEAWRSGSRSKWLLEPRVERYYGRAFCSVTFRKNGEVRVNIVAGGTANIDNWLVASDVRRTDAASIMGAVDGRFAEQQTVPRESLTSDTDPTALVYGPRESLGVGAFEETRALPYGPRESLGTGAVEPLRPDARHLPRPSAYFAGPGGAETGRPRARSAKPKVETFARARSRIFDEFKALGWDVHTKNTARSGRPLKVPYVTSRDGRQRLDFHAESVHADGHSIESDFRGATARRLIDLSARPNPSRWRANHHGGWHAPGDPLGYGPRANRTRKATQTRRRSR